MSDFESKVCFIISQTKNNTINQSMHLLTQFCLNGSLFMPLTKKPGEQLAIKSQKAFFTACWELSIFLCKWSNTWKK